MGKDIKKYNDMIAKFVGAQLEKSKDIPFHKWVIHESDNPFRNRFSGKVAMGELDFHKDWNWAIDVLRMVEERGCIVEVVFNLQNVFCRICVIGGKYDKAINIMHNDQEDDDKPITPVYNAICDYLDYLETK